MNVISVNGRPFFEFLRPTHLRLINVKFDRKIERTWSYVIPRNWYPFPRDPQSFRNPLAFLRCSQWQRDSKIGFNDSRDTLRQLLG